jgi:actin-like ATPase involved in cell morphogenesis
LLVLCSNRGYDQVVILGSDRNWIVWHPALVEMGFKRERERERVSDVGWKAKAIVKKLS